MAQLNIDKTYADGSTPFALDLDNIRDALLELFNIEGINDDSLQDIGITASTKFQDDTVTALKVSSAALNATNFANDNVSISVADLGVETADIPDLSIITDKFLNDTITGEDFADDDIAYDKIAESTVTTDGSDPGTGNFVLSAEQTSVDSITENATFTDVETAFGSGTALTAELTTQGGPVSVMVLPTDFNITGSALEADSSGSTAQIGFRITRDGTPIGEWSLEAGKANTRFGPVLEIIDDVAAGNYEYRLQFNAAVLGASNRAEAGFIRLFAFEL